jgi:hypothetical protein
MSTVHDIESFAGNHEKLDDRDISAALERVAKAGVAIIGIAEVSTYLANHADLLGVVDYLPTMLAMEHALPTAAMPSLEIYHDPEIDDEYLRLSLCSETFEGTLIEVLDRFQAWLAVELGNKSGWLQVLPAF